MLYILLIYSDESPEASPGTREFDDYLNAKGVRADSALLQPVTTATTLRVRNGKSFITDGPFAETEERLLGLYLLDCRDLDEALDYAAKIPTVEYGSIEVRPVRR